MYCMFSQYLKLLFIIIKIHSLYLQEMTTIRRWSKPKSFSGGGTPQHHDDLDGQTFRCTILDVDVSHIRLVNLRVIKPLNPVKKMFMRGFIFQMNLSPVVLLMLKNGMRAGQVQKLRPRELNYSGLTIKQILETLLPSLCTRLVSYQQFFFCLWFIFTKVFIVLLSCWLCRAIIPRRSWNMLQRITSWIRPWGPLWRLGFKKKLTRD